MLEILSQMPQGRGSQVPVINLYPCQLVAHEAFSSPFTQPLKVLVLLGSNRIQPFTVTGEAEALNMEEESILYIGPVRFQRIST